MRMTILGDKHLDSWTKVEGLLEEIHPGTTTVITGDDESGYRVRWNKGTDLKAFGGIMGSENAQINYLTPKGDWMDIPAF